MYIISLLVHEKGYYFGAAFEYSKVFPFSKVVVHVSKSANFALSELEEHLKR